MLYLCFSNLSNFLLIHLYLYNYLTYININIIKYYINIIINIYKMITLNSYNFIIIKLFQPNFGFIKINRILL
jgi:hypothetical protein